MGAPDRERRPWLTRAGAYGHSHVGHPGSCARQDAPGFCVATTGATSRGVRPRRARRPPRTQPVQLCPGQPFPGVGGAGAGHTPKPGSQPGGCGSWLPRSLPWFVPVTAPRSPDVGGAALRRRQARGPRLPLLGLSPADGLKVGAPLRAEGTGPWPRERGARASGTGAAGSPRPGPTLWFVVLFRTLSSQSVSHTQGRM